MYSSASGAATRPAGASVVTRNSGAAKVGSAAAKSVRGSSLLLIGKLFAPGLNFVTQVLKRDTWYEADTASIE